MTKLFAILRTCLKLHSVGVTLYLDFICVWDKIRSAMETETDSAFFFAFSSYVFFCFFVLFYASLSSCGSVSL